MIYTIEKSHNGIDWKKVVSFRDGDNSRFNEVFTPEIALKEAKSFREHYIKDIKFVRLITEL